jgi:peptidase C39-like protein
MSPWNGCVLIGVLVLAATSAQAQQACQERVLTLRFSPPAGHANNWCWAASGQMIMELLGEAPEKACQCRQAEQVLGVKGCCVTPSSCVPADDLPARCDKPRWPAFVESPERYTFGYATTCDALPDRQNDEACASQPLGWAALTSEICAGRPVIASFRSRGSARGHTIVVKGFSSRPHRRVLVVDPAQVCPAERDCEGELDEGFWISYDEYVAGWDGMVHWVDFYGIRRKGPGKPVGASVQSTAGTQPEEVRSVRSPRESSGRAGSHQVVDGEGGGHGSGRPVSARRDRRRAPKP